MLCSTQLLKQRFATTKAAMIFFHCCGLVKCLFREHGLRPEQHCCPVNFGWFCLPFLAAKTTCQSCLESTIPTSGVPCGPTGLDAEARAIYTQRVVSWTFTFGHWSKSFVSGVPVGQTRDWLCFAIQVGLPLKPVFWCDSADSLRYHNEKTLGKQYQHY